ncbi:MAG: dihydropteroate synthase [Leptospiraceae bacterium]|nr:dihydropteroate synthase [Leptospiraceae bacterium]
MSAASTSATRLSGIVNCTSDSFSDGGQYLDPRAAIEHARQLHKEGATVVDVGAVSSNPDADPVDPETEWQRLQAVLPALMQEGIPISVDSFQTATQRRALQTWPLFMLNDIHGFSDPSLYPDLRAASCKLVVMHSIQASGKARRESWDARKAGPIVDAVRAFFDKRLAVLSRAGIDPGRIVLDPGMGFFLGSEAQNSFQVLQSLATLRREFELPLMISVSRKSFLGSRLNLPIQDRGSATLAAELWALSQGVDWIRTHDVRALHQAQAIWLAIRQANAAQTPQV